MCSVTGTSSTAPRSAGPSSSATRRCASRVPVHASSSAAATPLCGTRSSARHDSSVRSCGRLVKRSTVGERPLHLGAKEVPAPIS